MVEVIDIIDDGDGDIQISRGSKYNQFWSSFCLNRINTAFSSLLELQSQLRFSHTQDLDL